jgi:outer membrane receptor protein involved in Fe transport
MEVRPEMINLYDVKEVEIIKGSNMYGFRGVNGVVLITTMTADDALKRQR